ncbi:MAG: sugar kinase [Anaerolineae bacterium]|nr:sugar kinase [Anaerolineae bacterium]
MTSHESRQWDVLVVGDLNADLILAGEVTPQFGQVEKLIDDATLTIGGSAGIFACGAARLGLRVGFVGKVGADGFGRWMIEALSERGIDTSGIVMDPAIKTGLTVILSRGNDRALLTYSGSIAALRFDDIDLRLLPQTRHLHLGSYFLLDALRPDVPALFEAAHAQGVTVSLDTNYDPLEQWNGGLSAALDHVDVFLPNETELCAIAGLTDVESALAALSTQTPLVVVKRGAAGAMARQGDRIICAGSVPVNAIDSTGAGDSFDAGFVSGYLAGWPLERTLRLACACGALSTRAAGGTGAQPTLAEAEAVLSDW